MKQEAIRDILEPIGKAPPEVAKIVWMVLAAERAKVYQNKPHLINDVLAIVKEAVQ